MEQLSIIFSKMLYLLIWPVIKEKIVSSWFGYRESSYKYFGGNPTSFF